MKTLTFKIEGMTPYSPGRTFPYGLKKPRSIKDDQWDEMNWTRRIHTMDEDVKDGSLTYLPVMAFCGMTGCLHAAAKNKPDLKIGKKGIASFIDSGISLPLDEVTGLTPLLNGKGKHATVSDFYKQTLFVPSDGKGLARGGKGTRVWRNFPVITAWQAEVKLLVLSDALYNVETLRELLDEAGKFVGLGRFRPERGGFNGRFTIKSLSLS